MFTCPGSNCTLKLLELMLFVGQGEGKTEHGSTQNTRRLRSQPDGLQWEGPCEGVTTATSEKLPGAGLARVRSAI